MKRTLFNTGTFRRRVVFNFQKSVGFHVPREGTALPSATRPRAAAQPRRARPTRPPSVSSAKGRAPQSNSASGGRGKVLPGTGLLGPLYGGG